VVIAGCAVELSVRAPKISLKQTEA